MNKSEAIKAVEKRIGRLLESVGSKQSIRDSLSTWFTHYASSKEYKQLSKHDKVATIRIYTAIILFFE
jgi:hypothetical protein